MDIVRLAVEKNREITAAAMVHHEPRIFYLNRRWRTFAPSQHVVSYHLQGVRTITGPGHTYELDHDSVCLFFAGTTYNVGIPKEPYHQMAIWFVPDKEDRLFQDSLLSEHPSTFSHVHLPVQIDLGRDAQIKHLFEEILHLSTSERREKKLKARILLNHLFCELLLRVQDARSVESRKIERVVSHIERHLAEKIVVNDLAASVRLSRGSLMRKFKAQVGKTVVGYQQQLRINVAASILRANPETPTKAISRSLGFCDQFYFSRVFRRIMGQTLSEYRAARVGATPRRIVRSRAGRHPSSERGGA